MLKELVDLQRNSAGTCAVILTDDCKNLKPSVTIKAQVSDKFLNASKPQFASDLDKVSAKNELCYFVITDIDQVSFEQQERFESLVKDREHNGYYLPKNCIVVFTVKDKFSLSKISPILYHFMVVAF